MFPFPGEGHRGHEILYHAAVFELGLDGVRVVRAGLREQSLKVVCRWLRLALGTMGNDHDAPY
jgi:hypothetical protein